MRGSFGVHGARQASNWQGAPSSTEWQAIADTTRRGYTGHEQIDNVMVVHMNGRVFDPAIGRFVSADPYVDCLQNTQGWNRYAYVKGKLMSATDPSGFNSVRQGFTLRSWIDGPNQSSNPGAGGAMLNVVVEASRLRLGFGWRDAGPLDFTNALNTTGLAPAEVAGGGGADSGSSQATDDAKKQCFADCMQAAQPFIQGVTGAAIGAATGGMPGMVAGTAIGLTTGYMERERTGRQAQAGAEIIGAAAVTYRTEVLSPRPAPGSTAAIAVSAVTAFAGTEVGSRLSGPAGLFGGVAFAGGLEATYTSLRSYLGREAINITKNLRSLALTPAIAGTVVNLLATQFAQSQCAQHCSQ
jgi:RHS repeat-associated protein